MGEFFSFVPLWRPEFLQTLDAKDKKWTSEDEKCVAFSDGTHAWRRHLTLRVASPMELKSFPFDGQLLKINLTFDADDTVLEIDQDLCQASLMQGATMLLNEKNYGHFVDLNSYMVRLISEIYYTIHFFLCLLQYIPL